MEGSYTTVFQHLQCLLVFVEELFVDFIFFPEKKKLTLLNKVNTMPFLSYLGFESQTTFSFEISRIDLQCRTHLVTNDDC